MATIHITDLDDEVVEKLKDRSLLSQRSLEGEARHILEEAVDFRSEQERVERIRAFRELSRKLREETKGTSQTPSEVLIRQDRDSGHRPPLY